MAQEFAIAVFSLLREGLLASLIKHNTFDRPFGGNFGHKTHGSASKMPRRKQLELATLWKKQQNSAEGLMNKSLVGAVKRAL